MAFGSGREVENESSMPRRYIWDGSVTAPKTLSAEALAGNAWVSKFKRWNHSLLKPVFKMKSF
jgi:hypothetical protein